MYKICKKSKIKLIILLIFTIFFITVASSKKELSALNKKNITVYNWGEFMAKDVNNEFFEKTGIFVDYKTFQSNEEVFAKILAGNLDTDVLIISDYMVSKLAKLGFLEQINFSNIPNYKLISEKFKNLNFDPKNEFSIPYSWGMFGIVYNSKFVHDDDLKGGWNILWNPKFSGKILMFDNSRDSFAISLLKLGQSINTQDQKILRQAAQELKTQRALISGYVMDQIFEKMASEEAWLAPYYAGDAAVISQINPNIKFLIPEEGTNLFVDSMCILKTSKNRDLAEAYINFLCEPEISKKNISATNYSTPNQIVINNLPEEIKNNNNFYPNNEILKKTECFRSLDKETEELIDELWVDIKVGKGGNPWITAAILLILTFIYILSSLIARKYNKYKKAK